MRHWNLVSEEHQFITELRRADAPTTAWILLSFEAVLLAPIREEFVFRGLLQPWAIGRAWGGDLMFALAAILGFVFIGDVPWALGIQPLAFVAIVLVALLAHERFWYGRAVKVPAWWRHLFPELAHSFPIQGAQIRRAIVGTSLLFAMMHSRTWPDPVPLTLLGLGLGWLAWRTQSLVAPFVCHALFNAFSLMQLRMLI
jgi:membrane protease YdiL (CAAX protease family)